ncbi:MAG: DUF4276 family protein [Conexivisphaerales archaeon]
MYHKIGLIVEGESDKRALKEIILKYGLRAEFGVCPGFSIRKIAKLGEMLKESGCEKVIVLRDTECEERERKKEELKQEINELERKGMKVCFAQCELETWLLADEKAIESVTGVKMKEIANPESIGNAKEKIKEIFRKKGARLGYLAVEHAPKIAHKMNVEKLERKCASFKEFISTLKDL